MAARDLVARIGRRAARAGLSPEPDTVAALGAYIEVLGKWNRKINLTAFSLDKPTDDAIDRLVIEPLAASKYIKRADLLAIDLGSGGGSPAIPLAIACPHLRMVLAEVKTRKAVFLREALRVLSLWDRLEVENRRFEELLSRVELNEAADVVTFRAVRADADVWGTITGLLQPTGRVFWFGGLSDAVVAPFEVVSRESLVATRGGTLAILTRRGGPVVV